MAKEKYEVVIPLRSEFKNTFYKKFNSKDEAVTFYDGILEALNSSKIITLDDVQDGFGNTHTKHALKPSEVDAGDVRITEVDEKVKGA